MDVIYEIKSRVSMAELLAKYNIFPFRGTNIYRCFVHDDKNPSANIIRGCDKFHCFACGWTGDIFDVVQYFEKCDHKKATEIINESFCLGLLKDLTAKEKQELLAKKKQRELEKQAKLKEERFNNAIRKQVVRKISQWQKIEHEIRKSKQYKYNHKFSHLMVQAKEEQERLDWLWHKLCDRYCWSGERYDYIYPKEKRELLEMIKIGTISI